MRAIALCRLWSKSTNVSAGHIRLCSSSRVTKSPACSSRISSTCRGCPQTHSHSVLAQFAGTDIQLETVERQPVGNSWLGSQRRLQQKIRKAYHRFLGHSKRPRSYLQAPCHQQLNHGENFGSRWRPQGLRLAPEHAKVPRLVARASGCDEKSEPFPPSEFYGTTIPGGHKMKNIASVTSHVSILLALLTFCSFAWA
jgi:hypothetical protein